jgi:hypothetical protein
MNFEVFNTEQEASARETELKSQGAFVIMAFNGHVWTIKWRER